MPQHDSSLPLEQGRTREMEWMMFPKVSGLPIVEIEIKKKSLANLYP